MGKFDALFAFDRAVIDLASVAVKVKRLPFYLEHKNVIAGNAEMKRHKKSEVCYILGLGPSLKDVDFSKINGDTIAVNGFYRFKNAGEASPTYYCIIDDTDYKNPDGRLIRDAADAFPDAVFLLNGKYYAQAERRISKEITRYYAFMWEGYFDPKKRIDFCKNLPIMGNVVCFAIMAALYIGYQKIILLGCDFNSFTFRTDKHCYQDSPAQKEISFANELFCYSFCADAHRRLYQYAKREKVKIWNATKGSLIDAYPYSEKQIQYYLKRA